MVTIFFRSLFVAHTIFEVRRVRLIGDRLFMMSVLKKVMLLGQQNNPANSRANHIHLINRDATLASRIVVNITSIIRNILLIIVICVLLLMLVGLASIAGMLCLLFTTLLSFQLTRLRVKLQTQYNHQKDQRLSVINELFKKFRAIRMTGLTPFFSQKAQSLRNKESRLLYHSHFLGTINLFFITITPLCMSVVTFLVLLYFEQPLTLSLVFTTIGLFMMLRPSLSNLTTEINSFVESITSLRRLQLLLNQKNIHRELNNPDIPLGEIQISDLHAQNLHQTIFNGISLNIKPGSLIAITGATGSGKTALLNHIAGYDPSFQGNIQRHGRVSHLQHYMWLSNDTLRNNILFGDSFDEKKYEYVINVCQLKEDISYLPEGDQSVVGELGIKLSGGQQQRLALARALYTQADILLLDNPMSALDPHLSHSLFHQAIRNSNATRLLITHDPHIIRYCDEAYAFTDGKLHLIKNKTFQTTRRNSHGEDKKSNNIFNTDQVTHVNPHINTEGTTHQTLHSIPESEKSFSDSEESTFEEENHRSNFNIFREMIRQTGWFSMLLFSFICVMGFEICRVASEFWLANQSQTMQTHSLSVFEITALQWQELFQPYLTLAVSALILYFIAQWINLTRMINHTKNSHITLLMAIVRAKTVFFDHTPQGRIISRFTHDLDTCSNNLMHLVISVSIGIVAIVIQFGLIAWNLPWIIPFLFLMALAYIHYQSQYHQSIKKISRLRAQLISKLYTRVEEAVRASAAIQLNQKEGYVFDQIYQYKRYIHRSHITANSLFSWFFFRMGLISVATTLVTALLIVNLSAGEVVNVVSLTYVVLISSIIIGFINNVEYLDQVMVSGWRIAEYSLLESESNIDSSQKINASSSSATQHAFHPISKSISFPYSKKLQSKPSIPPEYRHQAFNDAIVLRFHEVRFSYPNTQNIVLKNFSLTISAGETIGICGRSGAGKSSLFSLLLGLYPFQQGAITINQQDINSWPIEERRQLFSVITQTPLLFEDSIRRNLDPYQQHNDDGIYKILTDLNFLERIQQLKLGLDTIITDELFSAGEVQMLVLARTLLEAKPFILFDEATSDLDPNLMHFVSQYLLKHKPSHTTFIMISHHLKPLQELDKVIVMEHGQIKEKDHPQTLLLNPESEFLKLFGDSPEQKNQINID